MRNSATSDRLFAALIVLAAVLHLGLTEWGTQLVVDHCTYSVVKGGPSGKILIPVYFSVADTFSCAFGAISETSGLFTRWDLPPLIPLLAGVWTPCLLLLFALCRPWNSPRRLPLALIGAALFTFVLFVSFEPQWAQHRSDHGQQYLFNPYTEKRIEPPFVTFGASKNYCRNCTEFLLWGLYPRSDVPRQFGLMIGLFGSITMLIGGCVLGLHRILRKKSDE